MLVFNVHVNVKPEAVQAFLAATLDNARHSLLEPGIGRFDVATATRILFGPGTLREVGALAKRMGSRVLVVTGRTLSRAEPLLSLLDAHKISCVTFPVAEEPSVEGVCAGVQRGREQQCELVIGFGGGSALDAG